MQTIVIASPKGRPMSLSVRADTNDAALAHGIIGEDEYRLAELPPLTGWALDIGAHIGIVTVALAVDHPDLRIIAVEAVPENVEVLTDNINRNGLQDRVTVVSAAAASPSQQDVAITYGWTSDPNMPDGYLRDSRYIGGLIAANETSQTVSRPGVSLSALLDRFGIDRVTLALTDCEGCEYAFFADPAVSRIDRIIGEWHGSSIAQVRDVLAPTHLVRAYDDRSLFEAVR